MICAPSKNSLMLCILELLKRHSGESHRLTQGDIISLLESEYGLEAERKAVKRNLSDLLALEYPIEYTQRERLNGKGESEPILTDWYYQGDFSDSELHLLIDAVVFSKHIPGKQLKRLADNLSKLGSKYFNPRTDHLLLQSQPDLSNSQFFYTLELLDEAITQKKQVQFCYNDYGTDFKLHPRMENNGVIKSYMVNPYAVAAANGRYYLICKHDKYDNLANYRLDRISEVRILPNRMSGKPPLSQLQPYLSEHIYMFSGKSSSMVLRAKRSIFGELVDWFGSNVTIQAESDDFVTVAVMANQNAAFYWALQYLNHVEVLEPAELREEIKKALQEACEKYGVT